MITLRTGPNFPSIPLVIDILTQNSILVPLVSNDLNANDSFALRSGVSAVDIYGHDDYSLGFDLGKPTVWPPKELHTTWLASHLQDSPGAPYAICEFGSDGVYSWTRDGIKHMPVFLDLNTNAFSTGPSMLPN